MKAKFELGQVVATPASLEVLRSAGQQPSEFLARHHAGDWGDLDDDDRRLNDEALLDGSRILSAYKTKTNERIWIITDGTDDEGRRAATTILLPEEY